MARVTVRAPHGTPVEQAPWWVLVLLTGALWLVAFPALVGLLHGFGAWQGQRLVPALAAAVLAAGIVTAVATRKPWRRPTAATLVDERPLLVRLSTWVVCSLLYPNVLIGAILLFRDGPPPDYAATALLGVLLSTAQSLLARLGRRKT